MKRLIVILSLACWAPLLAQSSVFVLVDLSGNPLQDAYKITPAMRQEALAFAKAIITNNYNSSFAGNWKPSRNIDSRIASIVAGQGRPLIDAGGMLMIMPFGERNTYKQFKIYYPISNYPADFENAWAAGFPFTYDQQQTFGEIAKARAADVAAEAGISQYFLVVLAGKGEDTDSWSYTPEEKKYLDNYKSAAVANALAVFRYNHPDLDFTVEFSEINVSRIKQSSSGGTRPPIIQPSNVPKKVLEIVTPKGNRNAPSEFSEKDNITVQWRCLGCGENTGYKIYITKIEGGERVAPITVLKQFSHNVPALKAGVYGIKVSSDNLTSQQVYVKITSTGSWSWLLWLLALAAMAGLAYYVWKNFFKDKDDEDEQKRSSIFDPGRRQPQQNAPPGYQGGGQTSSPDSDYF